MISAPAGSKCATHGDRAAVTTCHRCGTFLCTACFVQRDDELATCFTCKREYKGGTASFRAQAAMMLAVLGIAGVYLPPLSLLAAGGLLLAHYEKKAIAEGRVSPAGKDLVGMVPIVAAISLLVGIGSTVFWLFALRNLAG